MVLGVCEAYEQYNDHLRSDDGQTYINSPIPLTMGRVKRGYLDDIYKSVRILFPFFRFPNVYCSLAHRCYILPCYLGTEKNAEIQ